MVTTITISPDDVLLEEFEAAVLDLDVLDQNGNPISNPTVSIPAGALSQRTAFEVEKIDDGEGPGEGFIPGSAYRIGPEGLELAAPAVISVALDLDAGGVPREVTG